MIFSQRSRSIQESLLNRLDSDVKRRIAAGEDILQFNLGQPDFPCPAFVREAIQTVNQMQKNNFYIHTGGTDALRQSIAEMENNLRGVGWGKEEVIITNGAKEALFLAFAALLDEGDEAIVIAPYWPTYREQISFLGARPVVVNADADFGLDMGAIRGAISAKTRLIVINNPNNPSGAVYTRETLAEIVQLAAEHDLLIVSDEVYNATVFEGGHISLAQFPEAKGRVVVIDGFSKTLSMTGYRMGYALASEEIIESMIKVKSNITGNTNSFFQMVIEEVFRSHGEDFLSFVAMTREEYLKRRDFLCQKLDDLGIDYPRPQGAFYVFARIPESSGMASQEFAAHLLDTAKIAVSPGIFFGEGYDDRFRISFGASLADLESGMARLAEFLDF